MLILYKITKTSSFKADLYCSLRGYNQVNNNRSIRHYWTSTCGRFEYNPQTHSWQYRKFYIASFTELDFKFSFCQFIYPFIYINFRSVKFRLELTLELNYKKSDLIYSKGTITAYDDHFIEGIKTIAVNNDYVMSFIKKPYGFRIYFYYKAKRKDNNAKKVYLRLEASQSWKIYNFFKKLTIKKLLRYPEIFAFCRTFVKEQEPVTTKKKINEDTKLIKLQPTDISKILNDIICDEFRSKKLDKLLKINIYLRFRFCKITLKDQKIHYNTLDKFKNYGNQSLYLFKQIPKLRSKFKGYINKLINEKFLYLSKQEINALLALYEDYENHIIQYDLPKLLIYPPLIDSLDLLHLLKKNNKFLKQVRYALQMLSLTSFKLHYSYNLENYLEYLQIAFKKIERIISLIEQINFKKNH